MGLVPSGSPLHLLHQQQQHLATNFSHFHYPGSTGSTGSPGSPGSPRAGLHPPLTRVASSPSFSSSGHHSTSPTAGLWPAPSQPLFSLANVISMAMTMAQSLAPPPSCQPQYQSAPLEEPGLAAITDRNTVAESLAPPFQFDRTTHSSAPSLQDAEVPVQALSEGFGWLRPLSPVSSVSSDCRWCWSHLCFFNKGEEPTGELTSERK